MDPTAFDACLREAIDALPEKIRTHLDDVAIVVEERPAGRRRGLLLGLYEGIPVTMWGKGFAEEPPDKITLYRAHILEAADTPEEVPHVIRETLYHEIAHHFGYDHDHIHQMERRWRARRAAASRSDIDKN